MTNIEKEAILTYLEFTLLNMVEQLRLPEGQLLGDVYNGAYDVLHEFERTLTTQVEMDSAPSTKSKG